MKLWLNKKLQWWNNSSTTLFTTYRLKTNTKFRYNPDSFVYLIRWISIEENINTVFFFQWCTRKRETHWNTFKGMHNWYYNPAPEISKLLSKYYKTRTHKHNSIKTKKQKYQTFLICNCYDFASKQLLASLWNENKKYVCMTIDLFSYFVYTKYFRWIKLSESEVRHARNWTWFWVSFKWKYRPTQQTLAELITKKWMCEILLDNWDDEKENRVEMFWLIHNLFVKWESGARK